MAVNNIDTTVLGKLLQIMFSEGVRSQISADFRDFETIKRNRVSDPKGREVRFQMQNSFGPAAVQAAAVDGSGEFPQYQLAGLGEKTAIFKVIDSTVAIPQNLLMRARAGKDLTYMDPLQLEVESKLIAAKRLLASWLYADGTGVLGTVSTATDTTGAGGYVTLVLSTADTARGHAGLFEYGDLLLNKNADGTADNPTVSGGTFYAWRVKDKIVRSATVVLEAVDSSMNVLSLTSSSIDATDLLYRMGQSTILDLSGSITSVADYGSATEVVAGLEALANNDGRTTWGVLASGATAGSRYDVGDVQIDFSHIDGAFADAKRRVGQTAYAWKSLVMSPETRSSFIMAHQTDRRIQSMEDSKRGVKSLGYQHDQDFLEFMSSEFVSGKRIWSVPEARNGEGKVLEAYMTDFEKINDQNTLLPGSTTYKKVFAMFMSCLYTLVCKHPAAVVSLSNFNVG